MTRPNPIPAAPGGESEAHAGVPSLGAEPKLAGRVAVCPADFSEIDGEDYDGALDGARSYEAGIAAIRVIKVSRGELPPRTDAERALIGLRMSPREAAVYLRDPNAPELRRGRW